MKKVTLCILLLCCLTTFGQKNKKRSDENQWSVMKVKDHIFPQDTNFMLFSLPKTIFTVEVIMTEKMITQGKYQAYSKKYLTIEPFTTQKFYMIESVKLSTQIEVDPEYLYYFSTKNQIKEPLQKWLNQVCYFPKIADQSFISLENLFPEKEWVPFELKRMEDNQDTARSSRRKIVRSLSEEEQASEIATQIFALRKRRIDLVTGEFELQNSEVLNQMLKEIDRLLSQYYDLFLGEVKTTRQIVRYTIIPNKEKLTYTVMQYSQDKGICSGCSETLSLTITPSSQFQQVVESTLSNAFTYRLPDYVEVKIATAKQEYLSLRVPVYQFGKMVTVAIP